MNQQIKIGVLGATSPVGSRILAQLAEEGINPIAFSRRPISSFDDLSGQWFSFSDLNVNALKGQVGSVDVWIIASPIWLLSDHFEMMLKLNARRIICISSTSRFTKITSASPHEERIVENLINGECAVTDWAEKNGVEWTILRPTLIYGRSTDRNLSEITKIIRRVHFFPLLGKAEGLRQPIYVDDVAKACVQAAFSDEAANMAYNISGAEQLTYREMVYRIFVAMGQTPRFLTINLLAFNAALFFFKRIPRYKNWNAEMALRMNCDMVFDHNEAKRDFGFSPRSFFLSKEDVQ